LPIEPSKFFTGGAVVPLHFSDCAKTPPLALASAVKSSWLVNGS
jgi:hypothetical protein